MADDPTKPKRQMPKGVRKGGTRFPRYNLSDAAGWAKKLVAKTHTGPQPRDVVFTSVLGSNGTPGEIKASALKQFGFLEGTAAGYFASDLAKEIASAPPEEARTLLGRAALNPTIFKRIFDTFHGDETTKAKLKQRAAALNVHPDETDNCIELYVASLAMAGLVALDGDKIVHRTVADPTSSKEEPTAPEPAEEDGETNAAEARAADGAAEDEDGGRGDDLERTVRAKAVFNVTVSLDSSLDTEKLEKQLKLLKKYGAI